MTGKNKCKILKEIRKQIANDNDIEFITSECSHQGECSGTCPKCEAEVRYLESELAKRQQIGKSVAVAGIAAAFMVSATGCLPFHTTAGAPLPASTSSVEETIAGGMMPPETLAGVPVWTDPTETTTPDVPGGIPYETEVQGMLMPGPNESEPVLPEE